MFKAAARFACLGLFFLINIHTVLSPAEFEALEQAGSKMAALTTEELQKMRDDGGLCVAKHLENLPSSGDAKEKIACCAYYLSLLLKLARQRSITRKCESCSLPLITLVTLNLGAHANDVLR